MTFEEIYARLRKLNIPVAYMVFDKPQNPPYIAYYESGGEVTGADNYNLYRNINITIELYTTKKNPQLEHQLEALFRDVELDKSTDIYIDNEKLLKIEYSFSFRQKIDKEV